MTTYATAEIDFSTFPTSDGEPMAETFANQIQMIDLQWALGQLLVRQGRPHVAVGGNQLIYYNPHNGWDHVSPDVYVILDRDPPVPPKWQTWMEGKFPDIVFEISSASTMREDVGEGPTQKPALYRRLGAKEYYIYDPQGDLQPRLQAYGWEEDKWVRREVLPSGGVWSVLLGAELRALPLAGSGQRPAGVWLRVLDPDTGQPIPMAEEQVFQEHHARLLAEGQVFQEHHARLLAEEQVFQEHHARLLAEEQVFQEHHARLLAEERARAAEERSRSIEATLQALLAEQEKRDAASDANTP